MTSSNEFPVRRPAASFGRDHQWIVTESGWRRIFTQSGLLSKAGVGAGAETTPSRRSGHGLQSQEWLNKKTISLLSSKSCMAELARIAGLLSSFVRCNRGTWVNKELGLCDQNKTAKDLRSFFPEVFRQDNPQPLSVSLH